MSHWRGAPAATLDAVDYPAYLGGIGNDGDDGHAGSAARAGQDVDRVDLGQQSGPGSTAADRVDLSVRQFAVPHVVLAAGLAESAGPSPPTPRLSPQIPPRPESPPGELLDLPIVPLVHGAQGADHARVDLGDRAAGRGDGEIREAVAGADHAHQFGNARGVRWDAPPGTNRQRGA
jgi:hypothetical protein